MPELGTQVITLHDTHQCAIEAPGSTIYSPPSINVTPISVDPL